MNFRTKSILKIIMLLLMVGFFYRHSLPARGNYADDINAEIQQLNDKINANKSKIDAITNQQQQYLDLINQKQTEQNTLNNELSILGDNLNKTQLEIDKNQLEIDRTNLEIKKTTLDIQNNDDKLQTEKDHMANLLKLMYQQHQHSTLQILLLNNSLADFINQVQYLQDTNQEVAKSVDNLKNIKTQLEDNQSLLLQKQAELDKLDKSLETSKISLQNDQAAKDSILVASQQSESRYQALLTQARKDQAQTNAEISALEVSVREKLAKLKNQPSINYNGFIWPVPKNTITTGFHDPDYPFRNLIGEHPAIDIRTPYGTPLKAAADGYVARVKFDGSKNYAYIMLIHSDGLSTVYGHVSAVSVKADDYVVQGQIIGKTGGLPGSPGSGPFTTGAHLHFEVRKDGLPVDPMNYLP